VSSNTGTSISFHINLIQKHNIIIKI
jgi:hypothetical protein